MPTLDKPLDELWNYKGTNPKPKDFDAYWDRALQELDATPPNPECTPNQTIHGNGFKCFDLTFMGVGQSRIHAKYLRPQSSGRHAAVLNFHGYASNSGDWSPHLNFVAQDFCVAAMDCRGQGGKSQDLTPIKGNTLSGHIIRGIDDHPDKLLFRNIFLDAVQLARVVAALPEIDPGRIGAYGGSQGGGLTLACAALEPRIQRIAPLYPFLSDYQRVWEMDLAKDAYQELKNYFRNFDPRHERAKEIFTKLGYIDVHHLTPRIKAETLMGTGLQDTITPPSSVFAAYNHLSGKKEMRVYPDFGHEVLPGFADMSFQFLSKL
jgi:cephalosporin-C deacetylase